MKPLLPAITLIILVTNTCVAQSDSVITISDSVVNLSGSAVTRKHYPIKSCRIVFRFFNGPQSGTKTVIFDDWGNKEKEEAITMTDTAAMRNNLAGAPPALRQMEIPAIQHNLLITVDGQRYAIDIDHHIGAQRPNLLIGGSMEAEMKQMGFAFVRTDTLLGKPCKVWEDPNAFRFWIWKDFYVIKKQMIQGLPGGMRIEEYPTEIDEAYSIKPDEFKIPDHIQFQ
jgi:hypothetical protein